MSILKKLFSVLEPILSDGAETTFQVLKEETLNSANRRYGMGDKELSDYMNEIERNRTRRDSTRQLTNRKLNKPGPREAKTTTTRTTTQKSPRVMQNKPKQRTTRKTTQQNDFWNPLGTLPEGFHRDSDDTEYDISTLLDGIDI